MVSLSVGSLAVLRIVSQDPSRSFDGSQLMERIFASTMERPMDSPQICESVAELERRGLISVVRAGVVDDEYDFVTVQITPGGLTFANRR